MKINNHILILICCLLFYITSISGQTVKCGTFYFDSLTNQTDPAYLSRKQVIELDYLDSTAAWQNDNVVARVTDVALSRFKIAIVVHLVGYNASFNNSVFSIQAVIDDVNDLFRKKSGTAGDGEGVDTEIDFCLAIKDNAGNPTSGVLNVAGNLGPYCRADESTIKASSVWNNDKFLNIWICDLTNCSVKSWATPPAMYYTSSSPGAKSKDGIVCHMTNFNAKILAHEIGHWLNLKHTFGDDLSTCGTPANSDGLDDTPWCAGSATAFLCGSINAQCTADNLALGLSDRRQIENYMDDSNGNCQNMFTLGQKIKMQSTLTNVRNKLANITTCPTCNDKIQNGDEVGTDCGGSCPNPCVQNCGGNTVQFAVNNYYTNTGKIINVCNNGNISIKPIIYSQPPCSGWWGFVDARITSSQGMINSFNCNWRPLQQKYTCSYDQLFLALQECDENKNLIGPEFGGWINLVQNTNTFNLYDYLPQIGNPAIVDGKYYKIKVATIYTNATSRWVEYNSYIKVFKSNLSLSNKSIIDNQYADNIHITDCSISSNIKVVAKNEIEILPNTSLNSGSYYIQEYNCSQISAFRIGNGIDSLSSYQPGQETLTQMQISAQSPLLRDEIAQIELRISPNPSSGLFTIKSENTEEYPILINVVNSLGKNILEIKNFSTNEINIDLTSEPQGIYVINVTYPSRSFTKKLIKN